MKNAVFLDIKEKFILHRRHITSPLQRPAGKCYVRFEVFTIVAVKNVVFWDVTLYGSCKNHVIQVLDTANVVSSSLILSTSETTAIFNNFTVHSV
jgi:hypothetical protein